MTQRGTFLMARQGRTTLLQGRHMARRSGRRLCAFAGRNCLHRFHRLHLLPLRIAGVALSLGFGFISGSASLAGAAPDAFHQAINAQRADDLGRAWELARQAVESGTDPRRGSAFDRYRLLVEIARDSGRLTNAEVILSQRGRHGGPDLPAVEWAMGAVYLWRNDFRTAIPHFERSAVLRPGNLDPLLGLVECHLALGDRSLTWLEALRTRIGHQWTELVARGLILDATGLTREALGLYEEAARFAPSEPEVLRLLAIAQSRLGELDRAETSLGRAERLARTMANRSPLDPASLRGARALAAIEIARATIDLQCARHEQALTTLARARNHAHAAADRALLAQALTLEAAARAEGAPGAVEPEGARRTALDGLRLARRIGDDQAERDALGALALLELNTFQTRAASERLKTALARAAETGDERGIEHTLTLLGLVSLARGEYLEALAYFNDASARARESGSTLVQQQAVEGASRTLLQLGEQWQAHDLAVSALALAEQIGAEAGICQSHLAAGRASYQLGLYDRAEQHLERAADLAARLRLGRLEGRAYLQLGRVAAALGEGELAQGWFRQALALARRARDPALEADGVSAIGEGFLEVGAFDEALREFELALMLATETGYLEGRLENMTRAAEVHKLLGDSRRAIALFKEGLSLSSGLKNRLSQAANYAHLGEVYASLGDLSKSLNYLNRALRTHRETGNVPGEGECLLAICRAHNAAGSYEAAVGRCGEALAFAEQHGNQAQRARGAIEIGNAHMGRGRADLAEPYFRSSHDLARSLDRPGIQWPAAAGMARVLASQGKNEPAIRMGREAVATLERLRNDIDLPEMRASFLEDKLEPYEQLVLLLVRQGLLAEAFRTMEYSRSRTLLEILTEEPASPDGRLAELRRKNQAMRREILRRTEELAAIPASADRDSATTAVLRALHDLRRQHDELRAAIGRELPDGGAAAAAEPLSLAEAQAMLSPGSGVLEYYVTRNELVIFLITRDAVRAVTRPESETHLAARVKLLRSTMAQQGRDAGGVNGKESTRPWEPPMAALTAALLDPVRGDPLLASIEDLIVVPHKFLHYVPFQALVTGTGGGGGRSAGERPRFLVEDYAVSYAPSASVLKHCLERDRGRKETLLALANPTPTDLEGRQLLYVSDEVHALKRRFGSGAMVRIGREATETMCKEEAGRHDIMHIAVHFMVDERDPLRSALDLAPSARDDGRLEVCEVMDMGVAADLVVLSGCSTAVGGGPVDPLPDSDDWVGLTRAFIHAGAPSVVATLWPVNDRSTSRFMDRFYELLPGLGKSKALARTQRDMLAGLIPGAAECSDPYHWAPFVLIGSGD